MSSTTKSIQERASEYAGMVTAAVSAVAREYGLPCDGDYVTMAQLAETARAAGLNPGEWFPRWTPAYALELAG